MTICIAASCGHGEEQAIILCADTKLSYFEGFGSSEMGSKLMTITKTGWCALLYGAQNQANQLALECGAYLDKNAIKHKTAMRQLKIPAMRIKRELMEQAAAGFGVSFDEYVKGVIQEKALRSDVRVALMQARSIDYGVILSGFVDGEPLIAKIEGDSVTAGHLTYATVGSGFYLAETLLNERKMGVAHLPFERVAYLVYEAKKFSERAEGVNDQITMYFQYPNHSEERKLGWGFVEHASELFLENLSRLHARYGLQPVQGIPSREVLMRREI